MASIINVMEDDSLRGIVLLRLAAFIWRSESREAGAHATIEDPATARPANQVRIRLFPWGVTTASERPLFSTRGGCAALRDKEKYFFAGAKQGTGDRGLEQGIEIIEMAALEDYPDMGVAWTGGGREGGCIYHDIYEMSPHQSRHLQDPQLGSPDGKGTVLTAGLSIDYCTPDIDQARTQTHMLIPLEKSSLEKGHNRGSETTNNSGGVTCLLFTLDFISGQVNSMINRCVAGVGLRYSVLSALR
ncbi:uncharacterized protein BP5553_03009 [Venustampulla echinocandica]|uniref:Uncharacterized protein n=1 Tax=Venustampulla echinocandica TaxID=2656787 RepID=A0A370TT11_9HELO|nr:uncharacterized protein BP5553_03009 [Venustampulla echinocandica]RDL38669.1 hypothetical protein BP5553_03009 [Venustampulla echinocandica]